MRFLQQGARLQSRGVTPRLSGPLSDRRFRELDKWKTSVNKENNNKKTNSRTNATTAKRKKKGRLKAGLRELRNTETLLCVMLQIHLHGV